MKFDFSDTLVTFDGRGRPNVFNKLLVKKDGMKVDYCSEQSGSDDDSSDNSLTNETLNYLKDDEEFTPPSPTSPSLSPQTKKQRPKQTISRNNIRSTK